MLCTSAWGSAAERSDTHRLSPLLVDGKYCIEQTLGTGGMGIVARATHVAFDQPVAIKWLWPRLAHDREAVARFEREARAAFRLRSEHAVRVLDCGRLDGGSPYMVMEYLRGADLADELFERQWLPAQEVVDLTLQVCEALDEAHSHGIIHRDLKPGNLFLTQRTDGSACIKVLDFGISKVLTKQKTDEPSLTRVNNLVGTPSYMAPEMWSPPCRISPATDLWALGAVMYELLSGQVPFDGANWMQTSHRVRNEPPRPLRDVAPDVPAELARIVHRCLEKDLKLRYRSARHLARDLARFGSRAARAGAARLTGPISLAPALPMPTASECAPTLPGGFPEDELPTIPTPLPPAGGERAQRARDPRAAAKSPRRSAVDVPPVRPVRGSGRPPPRPTMPTSSPESSRPGAARFAVSATFVGLALAAAYAAYFVW